MHDVIDLDAGAMGIVGKHLPQFQMMLDDLSAQTDDGLRARAVSALGRLTLFCLRHAREPQVLRDQLRRWLDLIREIQAAPGGSEALVLIWRYILITNGRATPEEVVAQLLDVVGVEHEEEIMTAGEQLIERGRKDGLEKGLKDGQEQSLVKLLRARFGPLPEPAVARIHAASSAQLDAWLDRVLAAATLPDVLDGA